MSSLAQLPAYSEESNMKLISSCYWCW